MQSLLTVEDLKNLLNQEGNRLDKILLILASFDAPSVVADIKRRAEDAGFRIPPKWNVSSILTASQGLAIRTPKGWELSSAGKTHLQTMGVANVSAAALQVAVDLRGHLTKIKDDDTRAFVEETIGCHEHGFYRSAVIMSWVAAMFVLQKEILAHHLVNFNAEAKRVDSRWKTAKTVDDMSLMKESEFLNRLATLSIIGKNTKTELRQCLDLRNACGHPNSLKLGPNTVARHLEMLMLNVFDKFA